jgi:hypothetical protein
MVLERRDTHFGSGGKRTEKKDLSGIALSRKSAGDVESNSDYDVNALRQGLGQRGASAFQSLAIHSAMLEQLKISSAKAMKKLEQIAEARRDDSLLALIKSDGETALVGFYLKPQQMLEQIFREFSLDRRYSRFGGVRASQLAGKGPSSGGAESALYDAVMKMDKALLRVEYAGNNAEQGGGAAKMKESIREIKTLGEALHKIIVKILRGEYGEVIESSEEPTQDGPVRITAQTMKERHRGKM